MIGASLSEPHTSAFNSTSVAFTKIYVEIRVYGMLYVHTQKFMFINYVTNQITYKCFQFVNSLCKELLE